MRSTKQLRSGSVHAHRLQCAWRGYLSPIDDPVDGAIVDLSDVDLTGEPPLDLTGADLTGVPDVDMTKPKLCGFAPGLLVFQNTTPIRNCSPFLDIHQRDLPLQTLTMMASRTLRFRIKAQ